MREEKALLEGVDAIRAELDGHRPLTPDLSRRITSWLLPRFIYCSSALGQEDALNSLETVTFLEREVVSGGHHIDKFLAIARDRRAYELVEQRALHGGVVDVDLIRNVHRTLVEGSRLAKDPRPGLWKLEPSKATRRRGVTFHYAEPGEVEELLGRLVAELAERRKTEHPVRVAAWLYFHLHLIRPFAGANGKVERLVTSCLLLHHGYPPLIIAPTNLGEYLDALVGVYRTVPGNERKPLSPRFDLSSLLVLVADCLTRAGERMVGILRGETPTVEEFGQRVEAEQEAMVDRFLARASTSWRVRASFEVRALHERLLEVVRRLQVLDAPLYALKLERADVVPTHAAERELSSVLPTADAGVVSQAILNVASNPTTKGLRFPSPRRLTFALTSTSYGMHLIVALEGERPRVHHGPPRSPEWPTATLTELATQAVDRLRREFERGIDNLNSTRSQRYKLVREQLRQTASERRELGEDEELGPPTSEEPAAAPAAKAKGAPQATRGQDPGLEGLRPAEPPLAF